MAILKYTDAEGNVHSINSYKINNVIVTQEKGESTFDVMSQKAVTDEIKKVNSLIPTKVSQLTNDENYLTQHQSLADYAKTADVNTSLALKADKTDVTASLANKVDNATYATDKTNINNAIKTVSDNLTAETSRATGVEDGIKAEVAKKANTTDVTTELNKKANSSDVDTTAQVDEKVNVKANAADVYTRDEIDTLTATMDGGEF